MMTGATGVMPTVDLNGGSNVGTGAGLGGAIGGLIGSWFGNGWNGGNRGAYGSENAILDSVNSVNQNVIASTNAQNQGFAGVNTSILTTSAMTQNSLAQGFAGLNTAVLTGDANVVSAIKDCCCETQKTIVNEGNATRGLIQSNFITDLQTKLCDEKAKNAELKSTLSNIAINREQTQTILSHISTLVGK